jgi:hypothetical protein
MKANANSFFKDADKEVEVLKESVTNISFAGDVNDPNNPLETWNFQDPEGFKQMIDEQYVNFKKSVFEKLDQGRKDHRTE